MLNKAGPSASESVASTLPTLRTEPNGSSPKEQDSSTSKDAVPTTVPTPRSRPTVPNPQQPHLKEAMLPPSDDFKSVVTLTFTYKWSRTDDYSRTWYTYHRYAFKPEFKGCPYARDLIFAMYIEDKYGGSWPSWWSWDGSTNVQFSFRQKFTSVKVCLKKGWRFSDRTCCHDDRHGHHFVFPVATPGGAYAEHVWRIKRCADECCKHEPKSGT